MLEGNLGFFLLVLSIILFISTASHALLTKTEPRGALAWLFIAAMLPILGAFLYYLFGKNRIYMRARRLKPVAADVIADDMAQKELVGSAVASIASTDQGKLEHYENLLATGRVLSADSLYAGNCITPLLSCEHAYQEMLSAIAQAKQQIWLSSYIFDHKGAGRQFIDALESAHLRGVEIRVLIDGIGSLYHWGRTGRMLSHRGIKVAKFLPPSLLPLNVTVNLRNHRKILLVDQSTGFVGGINILAVVPPVAEPNTTDEPKAISSFVGGLSKKGIRDIHFRVDGPVLASIAAVFADDWQFTTREALSVAEASNSLRVYSNTYCRVISDGPNRDIDKLTRLLLAAIVSARQKIYIMTPYFLPPKSIEIALQTAAMRGIDVRLYLPKHNNFHVMDWAMHHVLPRYLSKGVKVYMQLGGFIHSKLFIVDDIYSVIGSANMDVRSLRLNFELVLESYSEALNTELADFFYQSEANTIQLSVDDFPNFPLLPRLRNSLCWLFSPYL